MSAFRQAVEVIVRGVVLRRAVRAVVPAATLIDGLQTGSTLVEHLHEVVVMVGGDGQTDTDAVADLHVCGLLALHREDLALDGEAAAGVGNVLRLLHELGIDGTPRCTRRGLLDHQRLALLGQDGLHVTDGCGGLRQFERLLVDGDSRLLGAERETAALQEGIDGVDAVDGGVPGLRALLLQEPTLHLLNGLTVVGRQLLQGLDGNRLGGYLIVVPGVACTRGVVVTAQILTIDGIFLQRLHIFEGTLGIRLGEDDGGEGLLVDRLRLDIFLQEFQEVVVGRLYAGGELTSVEDGEVEPLESLEAGEGGLVAVFLGTLLDILHLLDDLLAHEAEGVVEHLTGRVLSACHRIETDEHLADGNGHIERARHILPP